MNTEYPKNESAQAVERRPLDSLRQLGFPAEFRIAIPEDHPDLYEHMEATEPPRPVMPPEVSPSPARPDERVRWLLLVTELATCLWYLKTKYWKRAWDDPEIGDDDPRARRALGRLRKAIDSLGTHGIEVQDPTNRRYPPGGEGLMRPIEFVPTPGVTFEVVTETIVPIIYCNEQLIQRGEVFVAVPSVEAPQASRSSGQTRANSAMEEPGQRDTHEGIGQD